MFLILFNNLKRFLCIFCIFCVSHALYAEESLPSYGNYGFKTYKAGKIRGFDTFFIDADKDIETGDPSLPQYKDFIEIKAPLLSWLSDVIQKANDFNTESGIGNPLDDLKYSPDLSIQKRIFIIGGQSDSNLMFEEFKENGAHIKQMVLYFDFFRKLFEENDTFILLHEYGHGVFPGWKADNYFSESFADLYAILVNRFEHRTISKYEGDINPYGFNVFCETSSYIRSFESQYSYNSLLNYNTTIENFEIGLLPHEVSCAFNSLFFNTANLSPKKVLNLIYSRMTEGRLSSIPFIPKSLLTDLGVKNIPGITLENKADNIQASHVELEEGKFIKVSFDRKGSSKIALVELNIDGKYLKLIPSTEFSETVSFYMPESEDTMISNFVTQICPEEHVQARTYSTYAKSTYISPWSVVNIKGLNTCFTVNTLTPLETF